MKGPAVMKHTGSQLESAEHDNDEEKKNAEPHSDAMNMFSGCKGKAASKECLLLSLCGTLVCVFVT